MPGPQKPAAMYVYVNGPPGVGPLSVRVEEGQDPQEAINNFLDMLPKELGGRWTPDEDQQQENQ